MISSLFSPINIDNRELKNRVIAAPPPSLLAGPDGSVSPSLLEYYQNLAETDVCMLIVESASISDEANSWTKQLSIATPGMIHGLSRLVEKIRKQGALPIIQLFHGGINALTSPKQTVYGPSALKHQKISARIVEMTREKIQKTVNDYASAATTAWNAGFSGIEIQAADGSLIQQFLSPIFNKRQDDYAIADNEGILLLQQVLAAVKKATPDLLLSLKLSLKDLVPGGRSLSSCLKTAQMLKSEGVDIFHLTEGLTVGNPLLLHPVLDRTAPDAPFSEDTQIFRHETGCITVLSGKINTPEIANSRLKKGVADFIALGRTLNREPSWLKISRNFDSATPWQKCLRCQLCKAASEGCPDRQGINRWLL